MIRDLSVRAECWPIAMVPMALVIDPRVNDSSKVTYALLLYWARTKLSTWTARPKIAKARGVSVSTLRAHLTCLEEAGWLTRREDGRRSCLDLHNERKTDNSVCAGNPEGSGIPAVSPPDIRRSHLYDELEERNQKEEEGPKEFRPADAIRKLLSSDSLNAWERKFTLGCQQDLGSKGLTPGQVAKLKQIQADAVPTPPTRPNNVPSAEAQTLRWQQELEHAEQVLRERTEDGLEIFQPLKDKLDRLRGLLGKEEAA